MRVLALLLACLSPQADAPDLSLRVTTDAAEVEFGAAFPLTVERAWGVGLAPEAWDVELLAPAVLVLEELHLREEGTRVVETRRYRAHGFRRDELVIPAAQLRARPRGGGAELVAHSDELRLLVRSSLDPEAPGLDAGTISPVELPPGPLPEPPLRNPKIALLIALLTAVALAISNWWRWSRTSVRAAAPGTPEAAALARLERLLGLEPTQRVLDIAAVLRTFVEGRYALPATRRTTEEVLAGLDVEGATRLDELRELLSSCDHVKFAHHAPSTDEAARLLDAARAFLRASASEDRTAQRGAAA